MTTETDERSRRNEQARQPTSALLSDLADLAGDLVRQEIALAGAEFRGKIGQALNGFILLVAAAILSLFAALALGTSAILALSERYEPWLAALMVGAAALVLSTGFGLGAWWSLRTLTLSPDRTLRSLKAAAGWPRDRVV